MNNNIEAPKDQVQPWGQRFKVKWNNRWYWMMNDGKPGVPTEIEAFIRDVVEPEIRKDERLKAQRAVVDAILIGWKIGST